MGRAFDFDSHSTTKRSGASSSPQKPTSYHSTSHHIAPSYEAELVRQAIALQKNEIDPQRKKLKRMVAKAIAHWSPYDKSAMLTEYGCRRKRFQSLDDALANAILINMNEYELEQLLSTIQ